MTQSNCQVWSSYQGSGRPDSVMFEGSRKECEDYIDKNSNEYNFLGLTCEVSSKSPLGDSIIRDNDGFLQWH